MKSHEERKFIVSESRLMSLFASCPICASPADAEIVEVLGTLVKVSHRCTDESCAFSQMWFSQPFVGRKMAVGNLLLSASILLSGNCFMISSIHAIELKKGRPTGRKPLSLLSDLDKSFVKHVKFLRLFAHWHTYEEV